MHIMWDSRQDLMKRSQLAMEKYVEPAAFKMEPVHLMDLNNNLKLSEHFTASYSHRFKPADIKKRVFKGSVYRNPSAKSFAPFDLGDVLLKSRS